MLSRRSKLFLFVGEHALTPSDHIEGAAEVARKQQAFNDDGVIDKEEQKEIDKAHKRQLEQRGRGKSQFKPWRTAKWMGKGLKERMPIGKDKVREREWFQCGVRVELMV